MSYENHNWLPDLIKLSDCGGDWDSYLNLIYSVFKQDFIDSKPTFRGIRLGLKKYPIIMGKEATFWHMISEGKVEDEREPDFRRCERIAWPRPIIENNEKCEIKVWENKRKSDTRILIWFEDVEYLVILVKRRGQNSGEYILPWTAYQVQREHRKIKLQKEYENYIKGKCRS